MGLPGTSNMRSSSAARRSSTVGAHEMNWHSPDSAGTAPPSRSPMGSQIREYEPLPDSVGTKSGMRSSRRETSSRTLSRFGRSSRSQQRWKESSRPHGCCTFGAGTSGSSSPWPAAKPRTHSRWVFDEIDPGLITDFERRRSHRLREERNALTHPRHGQAVDWISWARAGIAEAIELTNYLWARRAGELSVDDFRELVPPEARA
jgi:hypothetical protein